MKKILLSVFFVFFISSCDTQHEEVYIPTKPDSVPKSALWVGGLDGGVFVLVEKNKSDPPDEYWGEVYYVSGDIAYKGKMRLTPEGGGVIDYMNSEIFQGWDGDTLYVSGNRQLKIHK
jgi:hypothetical protein